MPQLASNWQERWDQTDVDLAALAIQFNPFHELPKEARETPAVQAQLKALRMACVAVGERRIALCMELQRAKRSA